jgi:hypothetical protein
LEWAYDLQAQCLAADVAYFLKQGSARWPDDVSMFPADRLTREFPK